MRDIAPPGFSGDELTIEFNARSRGRTCFDMEVMSKANPKVIFVITTGIEVWLVQRDVWFAGENITVGKWDDKDVGMAVPDKSHDQFCKENDYRSLENLFKKDGRTARRLR